MACGRPIIATPTVSFAPDAELSSAGRCVEADGKALALAIDDLRSHWNSASTNARRFAEIHFSHSRFIGLHRELYRSLLQSN
jgi:glycosyltransferase involved in cell wall biosynthesis